METLTKELEYININKDIIKNDLIQKIIKKYGIDYPDILSTNELGKFFFQKMGYSNLNLPIETEIKIKSYLQNKIINQVNYNDTFNLLISEFYKSKEYQDFLDNFNRKVNRSLILHDYLNKNNIFGFLELCDIDELILILK